MIWETSAKDIYDNWDNLNMKYLIQQLNEMKTLTWKFGIIN